MACTWKENIRKKSNNCHKLDDNEEDVDCDANLADFFPGITTSWILLLYYIIQYFTSNVYFFWGIMH